MTFNKQPFGNKQAFSSKQPVKITLENNKKKAVPELLSKISDELNLSGSEEGVKTGLEGARLVLEYIGYNTFYVQPENDTPFEQLFVPIGKDESYDDDRPIIQIFFISDMIHSEDSNLKQEEENALILEFFVSLPLEKELDNQKKNQIYELLAAFTNVVPIGNFGYSEKDGVFYRYNLMLPNKYIDDVVMVEIIQMIDFFIDSFYKKINLFAVSDVSIKKIIEESENELVSSKG